MVNYNVIETEEEIVEEQTIVKEDVPVAVASIEEDIPVATATQAEEDKPATYTGWKKGDIVTPGYFNNIGKAFLANQCCTLSYEGQDSISGSLLFPFRPRLLFWTAYAGRDQISNSFNPFIGINNKILHIPQGFTGEIDYVYVGQDEAGEPYQWEISLNRNEPENGWELHWWIAGRENPVLASNASGYIYTVTAFGDNRKYSYEVNKTMLESFSSGLNEVYIYANGTLISNQSGKLFPGTEVRIELDTLPDYEESYAIRISDIYSIENEYGYFTGAEALSCSFTMPSTDVIITIMDK